MKDRYFNEWEFRHIINISELNPNQAKIMYEDYLQNYPIDYTAYTFYASILIMLGDLDGAEKIVDYVENLFNNDKKYNRTEEAERFKENLFFTKTQLFSYQKKYDKLYKHCIENMRELKRREMESVLFYAKKKLGKIDYKKREKNSYLFRQIVRYDEKDFKNHIKKHLAEYNTTNNQNTNVFVENFPIDKVISEIKKYIPSDKRLLIGLYDNIYYFKYDGCGRDNNKIVDYIKVVCFDNTSDIITVCPCCGGKNLPYIDLNYLVKDDFSKVNRVSQIDKFNQKYNLNDYNEKNIESLERHIEFDKSNENYVMMEAPLKASDVAITEESRKQFVKTLLK